MKFTKKAISLVLALVMVGSLASVMAFAAYDLEATSAAYEVDDNVFHTSYEITSGVNGTTVDAQAVTFDPADGYLPVVFASNAGWASLLSTHFTRASLERWGYEPVGIINGSFFSTANGTLVGNVITDGRITCAHVGFSDEMVTFDNTGKMTVVKSCLDYKLYVNGKELANSLYYFNKVSDSDKVSNKIYYWDSACGTISDSAEYGIGGIEVLCNKVDNSELSVGNTLVGEVVSVGVDTSGTSIGTNQFVLFCKSDSPFASALKGLKAGSEVKIDVNETIAASKEVMENCSSAITNVGWLVKDGVDQTKIHASIGTHDVTKTNARWTAFGTKPDGSYVFFTTDGGSTGSTPNVTLSDVAKAMMELGCTNVIRMDGGGSSAMYLADDGSGAPGYVQSSSRSVSDCIMIVKVSSMKPSDALVKSLDDAIASAEEVYESDPQENVKTALDAAKAIRADSNSTEGDYKRGVMLISSAISGKQELEALIEKVGNIKFTDYSEYVLTYLLESLTEANSVLKDKDAADEEISAAYNDLVYWYNLTGKQSVNVTYGKDYTISATPNPTYPDTNGVELTDGNYGDGGQGTSPSWVGLNGPASYDVIVDLGAVTEGLSHFEIGLLQIESWGIQLPKDVVVSVSNDKNTWTNVGTVKPADGILGSKTSDGGYVLELDVDTEVSGRYIKYTLNRYAAFIFVGEVAAFADYDVTDKDFGMGDVNMNGKIDMNDYLMLRRAVLGTYDLNPLQARLGDVNGNGDVDANDYLVVKRHYLGTYTISGWTE